MEHIYTAGRVSDVRNKTVEQLRDEIENGDLDRMARIRAMKVSL